MTAPTLEPIGGGLFAEISYSPDDGAWYAFVVNDRGEELHQTELVATFADAHQAARNFRADLQRAAARMGDS